MNKNILNEINRYRELSGLMTVVEQENKNTGTKIYKLDSWFLGVSNDNLYAGRVPWDTYEFIPTENLGGQLSDFTVDPRNKNILNSNFKNPH